MAHSSTTLQPSSAECASKHMLMPFGLRLQEVVPGTHITASVEQPQVLPASLLQVSGVPGTQPASRVSKHPRLCAPQQGRHHEGH